jgi:hypothetical protein
MATICKETRIEARAETAWDALRDVGALHTRLAPGFVTDVKMEEGARVVTFGNGVVAREVIVNVDDQARRLVWTVAGGRMTHHNGAAQVLADGSERCRFVWTTDLLPDAVAPAIEAMVSQAMPIIKATLERAEAQQKGTRAPIEAPRLREFDFWLGSWRVSNRKTGEELGSSRVESVLGGRVLHEHWSGADGFRGESFNIFDKDRQCWHESWVGDNGSLLLLDGGMRDGSMDLQGISPDGAQQRIRWWPQPDRSVLQLWESSGDGGQTWECRFEGLYRPL